MEAHTEPAIDIGGMLSRLFQEPPRELLAEDPRRREGFARLDELLPELKETQGIDESLAAVLRYALDRVGGVEVAAILLEGLRGETAVRLAAGRGRTRPPRLGLSPEVLKHLPPGRAFLLEPRASGERSGLLVPLWGHRGRRGALYMDGRGSLSEEDLCLAEALASVAALQLMQERQALLSRVEENMRQYFGPDVVELILRETAAGRPLQPGVRERHATVVFVDLVGFSSFCRGRPPAEVVELLNPYFEMVAGCIQRHGGHVDKFIGDGVMGVFGAHPLAGDDPASGEHAAQAVRAAQEMIAVWALRAIYQQNQAVPLRVGINSGPVMVGNIGYSTRLEYSVIGDPVNMAARMEKLAPADGIAVTEETRRLAGPGFPFKDGGVTEVKGFGPVRFWTLE